MEELLIEQNELIDFLQDFEQGLEISFLEESKEQNELFAIAKAKGILAEGSRDLAVFKGVYTFADKPDGNKKRIPKQELLRKLPTLIGKAVTVEHIRRFVIGYIIDYRYIEKEDKVIVYGIIFKQIFAKEWEKAVKLLKEKKLGLSSEIWTPKEKRKYLSDGTYQIRDIEFAGCTVVYIDNKNKPAFEDTLVLETAKKSFDNTKEMELIFATLNKEGVEPMKCERCKGDGECAVCENIIFSTMEMPIPPSPSTPSKVKITCANCNWNFEQEFTPGTVSSIKCPNCFSILDNTGKVIHPPQVIDFDMTCENCKSRNNWLILEKSERNTKVRCRSCNKDYNLKFKDTTGYEKLVSKIMFARFGKVSCLQCGTINEFAVPSTLKETEIKCKKCGLKFPIDLTTETKRDIESYEPIQAKKEETSDKGEKKMVVLEEARMEKSKVTKLLRKACKKIKGFKNKSLKDEEEAKLHKAKLETSEAKVKKFVNGIKKFSNTIRTLKEQNKKTVLETSILKKQLVDKETELVTAKQQISQPAEPEKKQEVKLETATLRVGEKPKDDAYYAKIREGINESAFGHTKRIIR